MVSISTELLLPTVAWALTSGPSQPEFSNFQPVGATNMVNDFTGDFTYNLPVIQVPGPNGSGYALSLSYQSGASSEEDASWVGYGWTLNPGAINRATRGIPDDYKGNIEYWNKTPRNWTVSMGGGVGMEAFSKDIRLNANAHLRYNNYSGFGYSTGLGLSHKLGVSLGLNTSDGQRSYSAAINPLAMIDGLGQKGIAADNSSSKDEYRYAVSPNFQVGGNNGLFTHAQSARPTQTQEFTGASYSVNIGLEVNPLPLPAGATTNVTGSYSYRESKSNTTIQSRGYMYTADKKEVFNPLLGGNDIVTDYYVEKENPFQKRDVNLGIPFNNADNFIVSGEGIGGGFRMYHKNIGSFSPNAVVSKTNIFAVAPEIDAGFAFGAGSDISVGQQSLAVTGWKGRNDSFSSHGSEQADEPIFFKFNNDLGGNWTNGQEQNTDNYLNVSLKRSGQEYEPSDVSSQLPGIKERAGRASYIGYNTNKEINSTNNRTSPKAYTKREDIEKLTDRSAEDAIGEFSITTETGQHYLYGLPLYNRNESNFLYGVQGEVRSQDYLAYGKNEDTKIGQQIKDQPYASTFLLTQITAPDYIDKTFDGPSLDDLGGYTVFGYNKLYGFKSGNDQNWYKWRTPYTGMLYQRNSLSDPMDNMGSVAEGEKEVAYLNFIKTKTHIAFFRTENRADAFDAEKDPIKARTDRTAKGTNLLKKLTRIDLYLLSDMEAADALQPTPKDGIKPIKSIHFQYDYSGWFNETGVPNSASGKMMLKRVWFEYNGISKSKISPYEFKYTYPEDYNIYPEAYKAILPVGYTGLKQNPAYSPFAMDSWGQYQDVEEGKRRYFDLKTGIDQTPIANFDPAAWQLKRIALPSGGEIHVQYEQDDYAYVQDKPAHVMARLKGSADGKRSKFYLDLSELGTSESEALQMLKAYYKDNPKGVKKIYFKFLYALIGDKTPELGNCNTDYITGYADIVSVGTDSGGLYIEIGGSGAHALPYQVCEDFVLTQRAGKINMQGSCDPSLSGVKDKLNPDPKGMVKQLVNMVGTNLFPSLTCKNIRPEFSYFKIPFPGNKKGGGLRVKRLLTYDKGLEGQPVLYGSEYVYRKYDASLKKWRSSGVATNEPGSMREENALVDFIARGKQSWVSKIIAGEDKQQAEGPLGESIMPAPSVGYAEILVKNIHSGKTSTGFTIKEYFTAKEYPVIASASEMDMKTQLIPVNAGLVNINTSNVWATQNYLFKLNNMHGQIKRVATYTGTYNEEQGLLNQALSSEQVYEYFEPGEPIPVQEQQGGGTKLMYPGKETDITLAHKSVKDAYIDVNVEFDVQVAPIIFFPLFYATFFPSLTKSDVGLHTYATSKVVRYPAIMKRVSSYRDGMKQSSEHLAFDKFTGQPVLTKTEDEVKGQYVNREAMVSWLYPLLGAKYLMEGKTIDLAMYPELPDLILAQVAGKYFLKFSSEPSAPCIEFFKNFSAGDLIMLNENQVGHIDTPDQLAKQIPIYAATVGGIATDGMPITKIRILRSGRSNLLSAKAGATTFHFNMLPENFNDPIPKLNTAFDIDLNSKLASGSTSFVLAGPYTKMNLAYFGNRVPPTCPDNGPLDIRNVAFKKILNQDGSVTLELLSFSYVCAGVDTLVE